ncbi:MAG TPA: hypothetical protein PLZ36_10105 [Armatimonadota bacterium]|nr:hypothetical protein [Armatimonadota bacterium]
MLGADPASPAMRALGEEVRTSPRVTKLLSARGENGKIPGGVYQKWMGAHWVLATLADLGYPSGDAALAPLVEQVCACWLGARHVDAVRVINGRVRRCASQESNALYALLTLGFHDARVDRLAENLLRWQWPDGGWNCDTRPEATTSSFHESWIPVRALALYARLRDHAGAREAVARAAEIFLSRRLFRRRRDGSVMTPSFLKLIYPPYWHYSILNGLKVMAEAGCIGDPRCADALDVLESKRLPDGGFPAEAAYYKTSPSGGNSLVEWGGARAARMNPWVTAEALGVLAAGGRR